MFSDTFAGIQPSSVPGFVLAQLAGAGLGAGLVRVLYPDVAAAAADVVVPHEPAASSRGPGDRLVRRQG
jgi:arsenate reductase